MKKNKQKIFYFVGTFCILMIVSWFFYSKHQANELKNNQKLISFTKVTEEQAKKALKGGSFAEFREGYPSFKELRKKSDVIVQGKVVDISYFDRMSETYTLFDVQVIKSNKNKFKKGEIVSFIQVGGYTTQGKQNQLIETTINGAPLTKVGEEVLIFAVKDDSAFYGLEKPVYIPLNSYQGLFKIKDGFGSRYAEGGDSDLKTPIEKLKKEELE